MFAWFRKGDRLEVALGLIAWVAIIGGIYEFHHVPTSAEVKRQQAEAAEAKQRHARTEAILNRAERCEATDNVSYECLRAEHDADELADDAKAN